MQIQRHIEQVVSIRLMIDLPSSFLNHRVEVLILTLEEPPVAPPRNAVFHHHNLRVKLKNMVR